MLRMPSEVLLELIQRLVRIQGAVLVGGPREFHQRVVPGRAGQIPRHHFHGAAVLEAALWKLPDGARADRRLGVIQAVFKATEVDPILDSSQYGQDRSAMASQQIRENQPAPRSYIIVWRLIALAPVGSDSPISRAAQRTSSLTPGRTHVEQDHQRGTHSDASAAA